MQSFRRLLLGIGILFAFGAPVAADQVGSWPIRAHNDQDKKPPDVPQVCPACGMG